MLLYFLSGESTNVKATNGREFLRSHTGVTPVSHRCQIPIGVRFTHEMGLSDVPGVESWNKASISAAAH